MTNHVLKIYTGRFPALLDGLRTSEVRFGDRNYVVGDEILFVEGETVFGEFKETGRSVKKRITHIDTFGLQSGFVNLYLENI